MPIPQKCCFPPSFRFVPITVFLVVATMLPGSAWAAQQLNSSPTRLRFGVVALGQSETQMVMLTNTGESTATISAINIGPSEFHVSGMNLPATIPAGQSVSLNITFSPTADGYTGGWISFASNTSGPNLEFEVAGYVQDSQPLTATPSTLSFGQVAMGNSDALSVTVTNTRPWSRTITAFQPSSSAYTVSGPTLPYSLAGGQSITLTVTFTPQAVGQVGGSVFIAGAGVNVPLTGTGMSSNPTNGQLSIAPSPLNLGSVNVGSSTTQAIAMSASGAAVTVNSAASSSSQFAISGTSFPFTIPAGKSVSVNVGFSPTQAGAASGTLSFASNASNSQTSESVSGTGVAVQYSVNLSWSPSTSSVSGYNVYRGTAPGSYSKINGTLNSNTAYTDSSVVGGTTYYYAATAVNSAGQESPYSSPIQVAIP